VLRIATRKYTSVGVGAVLAAAVMPCGFAYCLAASILNTWLEARKKVEGKMMECALLGGLGHCGGAWGVGNGGFVCASRVRGNRMQIERGKALSGCSRSRGRGCGEFWS
jgi:hypothetical protein